MRRKGKILCVYGVIALVVATIFLLVLTHLPFPYGNATLPGGMADDYEAKFYAAMEWRIRAFAVIFSVGLSGALFLLAGIPLYVISWCTFPKSPVA